jgi:hypothetical protein
MPLSRQGLIPKGLKDSARGFDPGYRPKTVAALPVATVREFGATEEKGGSRAGPFLGW